MTHKAHIPHRLPTLNEYTRVSRGNKYGSNKMKQNAERIIQPYLRHLPKIMSKVDVEFTWFCGNKRIDPDNLSFAKKMILDALVKCQKIENDSPKMINGFKDNFIYGKDWGVTVNIREVNDYDSQEAERNRLYEYEDICQWIHKALGKKKDWADMFIAVRIDGIPIREYARSIDADENNISQKLKRAEKKLKEFLENRQI